MAAVSELRAHARDIFDAGVRAADPLKVIQQLVHVDGDRLTAGDCNYDLAKFRKISVIGAGKAAARMALALEELMGTRIADGLVVVKAGHGLSLKKIRVIEAAHPVPDEAGLRGARQVMELLAGACEQDLIIFLISGGASALLPAPAGRITLVDKQRTTRALLASGATIGEVNAVRKHISKLKGGRLAQLVAPATLVSLILSDVVGDALEDIASGPTVADPSTYADCLGIIRRYSLQEKIPAAVLDHLARGANAELEETPKPDSAAFGKARNIIVGSNRTALAAAQRQAEALGYHTMILSDAVEGESRSVAAEHAALVRAIQETDTPPINRPACLLAGGETTVTVRGNGLGGRNQEYALAAAMEIDGADGVVALSAGTDGTDGPTDAAGAIVDGATIARGKAKGLTAVDFLRRNDSYHFLQATDDLMRTGPTLTNVMDLQVWLIA